MGLKQDTCWGGKRSPVARLRGAGTALRPGPGVEKSPAARQIRRNFESSGPDVTSDAVSALPWTDWKSETFASGLPSYLVPQTTNGAFAPEGLRSVAALRFRPSLSLLPSELSRSGGGSLVLYVSAHEADNALGKPFCPRSASYNTGPAILASQPTSGQRKECSNWHNIRVR